MDFKYLQVIILAAVFALQYIFEHVYPQRKEINSWKNERFNILVGIGNILVTFIPAALLVQGLQFAADHHLGLLYQFTTPFWLQLVVGIFLLDCWMYFWHKLNHIIPFFWRFHSFHHKDEKMNTTTAIRFHFAELLMSYPGKALVCFIFGIGYTPLLVYELLFFVAVIVHHSNIYISPAVDRVYRMLFSSPIMHRIHHSNLWEHTNSNYGALFSFWDRLFKSLNLQSSKNVQFGLPANNTQPLHNNK